MSPRDGNEIEKIDAEKVVTSTVRSSLSSKSSGNSTSPTGFSNVRPDVASIMVQTVARLSSCARVLVAACGPSSLTEDVQIAVTHCTTVAAPSIDLHIEQFSI